MAKLVNRDSPWPTVAILDDSNTLELLLVEIVHKRVKLCFLNFLFHLINFLLGYTVMDENATIFSNLLPKS